MSTEERGRRQRDERDGYGRFVTRSVLGALVPGSGLIAAGRRRLGFAVLGVFLAAVAVVVVYALSVDVDDLLQLGTDAEAAQRLGFVLVGVAVVWVAVALAGFFLLEPAGLPRGRRLVAALAMVVAASVIAVPLGMGAQRAFTHHRLIESVFADDDDHPDTTPTGATDEDPWAGESRVNILLLGADSAPNREGTRTDTIMVASIDVTTGDTALLQLPRNLQYAPMPPGPLRDAYPDGYRGLPESAFWLSSVYQNIPDQFPDLFGKYRDPGAEAMKVVVSSALNIPIDYYVMVNLRGFQDVVTALGGITMDVPYDIPIGTKEINGYCTEALGWVRAGENQHLDGFQALWVARARCGPGPVSGDYSRMRRQRCVIAAIADKADPQTLLVNYQSVAAAAKNTITTDIPQSRLSAFAELGTRVKDGELRSLPFTDEIVTYYEPDYALIRQLVTEALAGPPAATASPTPTDSPTTTPTDSPTGDADTNDPDDAPTTTPSSTGVPAPTGTPGTDEASEADGAQDVEAVC
jgi:LCP family protein required for cell wall assembly